MTKTTEAGRPRPPAATKSLVLMSALLALWTTVADAQHTPRMAQGELTSEELAALPTPVTDDQFSPFDVPPYPLDDVRGEWVNLETQLIKPILVTADGKFVVVANPADNRVVVFNETLSAVVAEIFLGQGIAALAERPASDVSIATTSTFNAVQEQPSDPTPAPKPVSPNEIWVSVRHQNYVAVINTRTWRLKALVRPPIAATSVGARRAAAPGGIAFNKNGTKAYVASSFTDELLVFDAATKAFLQAIPLTLSHNGRETALNDPMAVVSVGNKVYVASHLSGNQTIIDSFNGFMPNFGPEDVTIFNLATDPDRSLPDFDIMEIDTVSDTVTRHQKEVGTTLFGMIHHPATGQLIVSNFAARNGEFKGEESFPNGQVVFNRLTVLTPGDLPSAYSFIVTEGLGASRTNVVMPTDLAVDDQGRVFVAGYASSNVGVFSATGGFLGVLPAESGPRGLAHSSVTDRLYILNRAQGTVSFYNVASSLPAGAVVSVPLPDPTFDDVKAGRSVFLDPTHSGAGTTGCFSCHQDARKDNLGWILAKFFGIDESVALTDPDPNWKDQKGVKTTQDLRSLPEVPPYHWRGEQLDLEAFNGAFVKLLHGPALDERELALFKEYVFSTVYPPDPFQQMNRNYTANGLIGANAFMSSPTYNCTPCHALPTGTNAGITLILLGASGIQSLSDKTTQLRGNWTKHSDLANIINDTTQPEALWPVTGFGFDSEGPLDSIAEFINFFFSFAPELTDFITELDTGLAPATAYSERLTAATVAQTRLTFLIDQANNGNCDIAVRGRLRIGGVWQNVGLVWNRPSQLFVSDQTLLGSFSQATLQSMASAGDAQLLILGVPVWSGERMGVDRDRDGVFDGDEVAQGLDPKDFDTDDDGLWDSYDPQPLLNPNTILPVGAPQVVPNSVRVIHRTTNSAKIVYETDTFSPTRVEFGTTTSYGFFSGDPLVLPAGSNHWKRRHTVFLRPQPGQGLLGLEDGVNHHFRIHTRGQNGATAVTGDFESDPLLTDRNVTNLRLQSINVTSVRTGSDVLWTATVQVTDNHGNPPASTVMLSCRFTHFSGTTLMQQDPLTNNCATDAAGVITFTSTTNFQVPGDVTFFDIPMHTFVSAPAAFAWPEGPSCVETTAP